jgi:hypothetical protein
MNEKTLIELGFERHNETPFTSGSDTDWHYYTLRIGDITLISNESNVASKFNIWEVSIFDSETMNIKNGKTLKKLIEIINESTTKI